MTKQSEVQQIPWQELFRIGVLVFKLSPEEFWQLTMAEFAALSHFSLAASSRITVPELKELQVMFPDG